MRLPIDPIADLRLRWQGLMQELEPSAVNSETLFQDLVTRYSEPHRHYHTLAHIRHLLQLIQESEAELESSALLQLTAWYHDAVYDPSRTDNEAKSAELATEQLLELNLPESEITCVNRLVLATARHQLPPEADTPDNRFFLDADLAILGAEPQQYEQYRQQIRQEFRFVPEAQYRLGRAQVLQQFLDRPHLYHTPILRQRLENQARENLQNELQMRSL